MKVKITIRSNQYIWRLPFNCNDVQCRINQWRFHVHWAIDGDAIRIAVDHNDDPSWPLARYQENLRLLQIKRSSVLPLIHSSSSKMDSFVTIKLEMTLLIWCIHQDDWIMTDRSLSATFRISWLFEIPSKLHSTMDHRRMILPEGIPWLYMP